MKSTIQRALLAVAVASLGAGAVGTACAQSSAPASSGPVAGATPGTHHHGFHRFGGSRFVGTLLRATKQLGLSSTQQASIKSILQAARPAHQPGSQPQGPGMTVLGNPGDPGYAAAIQSAELSARNRLRKETELAGEIYNVLTGPQQAQLHTVLASMQAQQQARRAQWAAKHAAANG
ncbi:MAG TPA: hypothetical protein VGG49_10255 [Steroidobacteraceae bacterium]